MPHQDHKSSLFHIFFPDISRINLFFVSPRTRPLVSRIDTIRISDMYQYVSCIAPPLPVTPPCGPSIHGWGSVGSARRHIRFRGRGRRGRAGGVGPCRGGDGDGRGPVAAAAGGGDRAAAAAGGGAPPAADGGGPDGRRGVRPGTDGFIPFDFSRWIVCI